MFSQQTRKMTVLSNAKMQQHEEQSLISLHSDSENDEKQEDPEEVSRLEYEDHTINNHANSAQQVKFQSKCTPEQFEYENTWDYLLDIVGNSYIDKLGKSKNISFPDQNFPPKIQSSSTCKPSDIKQLQKNKKVKESAANPAQNLTKVKYQQKKTHKKHYQEEQTIKNKKAGPTQNIQLNLPSNNQKNKGLYGTKIQKSLKTPQNQPQLKREAGKQDKKEEQSDSKQRQSKKDKQQKISLQIERQQKKRRKEKPEQKGKYGNTRNQDVLLEKIRQSPKEQRKIATPSQYSQKYSQPPHLYPNPYNNQGNPCYTEQKSRFKSNQIQQNYPRAKKQNEYVQRKRTQEVNGWKYLNRGNVVYDDKNQLWITQNLKTIEERYIESLRNKPYILDFEMEAINHYYSQRHSAFNYVQPNQYINNYRPYEMYPPFNQQTYYSHHTGRLQDKSTHQYQKKDQNSCRQMKHQDNKQVIRDHQQKRSSKEYSEVVKCPREQSSLRPQTKTLYSQPNKILPDHIPAIEVVKVQSEKPVHRVTVQHLASQKEVHQQKFHIFVIYDVPIIITRENVNKIQADIVFLPYCSIMYIENSPSKWMKFLEEQTGLKILSKIAEMNERHVKEKGKQIAEGTLSKIRLDTKRKFNFNFIYLAKLTTMIDETSKTPYGQKLLKDMLQTIVQSLSTESYDKDPKRSEKSILIHGGFIPGVKRVDTPRILTNYLSIALGKASIDYKKNGCKPKKIFINVPKEQEYEQYLKEMKKIQIQYRKIQSL